MEQRERPPCESQWGKRMRNKEESMKHGLSSIARFRRGASVLIALLVFFLAALSGTLVLTMAASNAGRYTHEKEDQQAYFSVASALELIQGQLDE